MSRLWIVVVLAVGCGPGQAPRGTGAGRAMAPGPQDPYATSEPQQPEVAPVVSQPGGSQVPVASPRPGGTTAPPPPTVEAAVPAEVRGMLEAHNAVRARHCAAPMVWSPEVARVAQGWANHLRDADCGFDHSSGKYGENLAAGTSGYLDVAGAVDMWYREIKGYDFANPGFSMSTGHFTQVVWRSSRKLGCGAATCKGLTVYVCNYDPPGNMQGSFPAEVVPEGKCKP